MLVLVQVLVVQALAVQELGTEGSGVLVLARAMVGAADLDRCQQPALLPLPTRKQHQATYTAASNTKVS